MSKSSTARRLAAPAAAVALAFGLGLNIRCAKKPEVDPYTGLPVPTHSLFIGQWVGRSAKTGDIYSFTFTKNTWESYVEKDGAKLKHYRGSYTHDGSSISLRVTEKGDRKTMEWVKAGDAMAENVSGRLAGSTLRIPTLVTDTELVKR